MSDKERLSRAFQEYLKERAAAQKLNTGASASLATGQHVIIMALVRIATLLEKVIHES